MTSAVGLCQLVCCRSAIAIRSRGYYSRSEDDKTVIGVSKGCKTYANCRRRSLDNSSRLSRGKIMTSLDDAKLKSCPCHWTEPCHKDCPCVKPWMSRGCQRCCTFGSDEQRRKCAQIIADCIDAGVDALGFNYFASREAE